MYYHITFDIDWAPDDCIELCLNILKKRNVKATFFATHNSDILNEIKKNGHEIGIHPNFMENSSHGKSIEEIVEFCLKIVPDAKLMRTHSLYQSTRLLTKVFKLFPQLKIDLSIFTYHFPKVCLFDHIVDDVKFKRINFNWEDDFEFWNKNFNWDSSDLFAKINILNFHPIHIFLNSNSNNKYKKLINDIDGKPIYLFDRKLLNKYINSGVGAQNYLRSVISSDHKQIKLREIK